MSDKLKITISGRAGSGKSSLAFLLERFLSSECGFTVFNADYDRRHMSSNTIDATIENVIKRDGRVDITTKQLLRGNK